ncbi:MAG TPA: carbamoyl-phosphate synthase large subunit, partial [Methanocella sp.]|nr:carbamoyl-phosphate synthase large subunit [Methanocella sp.]
DADHQTLRSAAIKIIRALGIEGGCNIQFAWRDGDYRIVEVNPRVSRSSALASKATGYPIARIAAKIAIGLRLDEIKNRVTMETPASFEPTIDYVVVKIPRWPFDKFKTADPHITTSMKSTGEVMAIGRCYEEALQKALNSLDISEFWGHGGWSKDEMAELLQHPTHERMFVIFKALRTGAFTVEEISKLSSIDPWFVIKIKNIVDLAEKLKTAPLDRDIMLRAKRFGFTDEWIAGLRSVTPEEISDLRHRLKVIPTYKMVDTCAAEFSAKTPYYYSTYEEECELSPSDRKKVLIIGAGPIRIGQGIEFDYCTVHAVEALRQSGIEAHIINNNPETVSTDFDTSDKLFFEPITLEHVMNIIEKEKPHGVMVQFGGQTSVNMAIPLQMELNRRKDLETIIIGTSPDDMNIAEDRDLWSQMMKEQGILQPDSGIAYSVEEAKTVAKRIGYPILVRPSYVLGGRAMEVVYDEADLDRYMTEAVKVSRKHPVLIDDFLENATEIDVDAVSDGKEVMIGAIMEHIEEAGIHSGDSACVIPPQSLSGDVQDQVRDIVKKIALSLRVIGCVNIQMAYKDGKVFVLEANPRSSRTIPFVSKATGVPLAKIAAKAIIGCSLKDMGYTEEPKPTHVSVKEVVLPFDKLPGADPLLGPEMKSTGEVMGIDRDFGRAYFKAELSAFNSLPQEGTVFISVRDADKEPMVRIAKILHDNGLNLIGTEGTRAFLEARGIPVQFICKVHEGSPNVIDMIRDGKVHLVINTPTSKLARMDGFQIRRAAVDYEVPYVTTIQAARASAEAINAMGRRKLTIKSLNEYLSLDRPVAPVIDACNNRIDG